MKVRTKLLTWTATASLLILTTSLTTGCGGTKTDTAASKDATTETAKPVQSPKASASPSTATVTNEKTSTTNASPAKGEGRFAEVEISKLETYTHPGGVFSMDIPEGWTKQDTSKPDEVIISWTDPARNSLIIMDIFEIEANPSKADLGEKLKEFITGLFGKQPKFEVADAKE